MCDTKAFCIWAVFGKILRGAIFVVPNSQSLQCWWTMGTWTVHGNRLRWAIHLHPASCFTCHFAPLIIHLQNHVQTLGNAVLLDETNFRTPELTLIHCLMCTTIGAIYTKSCRTIQKVGTPKVPPRFELGSLDSESKVLTITPWDRDAGVTKFTI